MGGWQRTARERLRRVGGLLAICTLLGLGTACARVMPYPRLASGPELEAIPEEVALIRAPAPRPAAPPPLNLTARPSPTDESMPEELTELLDYATGLVGGRSIEVAGERFRMDCSGLVRACYASQGFDLFEVYGDAASGSEAIYRYLRENGQVFHSGTPAPGDILIFHDSWDRNRNGRMDDPFSHVAIVEDVDADGTATMIHVMGQGIIRSRVNLDQPEVHTDPATGEVINDWLRRPQGRNRAYTTGELLFAYGRLFDGGARVEGGR